jgi:hypothetical protein
MKLEDIAAEEERPEDSEARGGRVDEAGDA